MFTWLTPNFQKSHRGRHLVLVKSGSVSVQGFSLAEVLVAILITMIFLTVSLQLFVTAAYLRARAGQLSEAYSWVQEDFEVVRSKATAFEKDALPYSTYCGGGAADNLAATFISDNVTGLGGALVTVGRKNIDGEALDLIRTASYATTANPERLVALKYALVPTGGGAPTWEIETELVVYAAFRCPD